MATQLWRPKIDFMQVILWKKSISDLVLFWLFKHYGNELYEKIIQKTSFSIR